MFTYRRTPIPDLVEALTVWQAKGFASPEHPILPWRSATGKGDYTKQQDRNAFIYHWGKLQRKYGLPHLRPVDVRHWVASSCRKAGLSKQATAALMGHDPTQGGAMCDWYDNPQTADYLDEQALRFPNGPLGMLDPPAIEIAEGMPPEVLSLVAAY